VSGHATSLPRARRRDATATVGMTIFLGAIAMLFAALFFAYAVMRAQAPTWPPPGQAPLPRGALGLNTLILIAASVVLRAALAAARRGELRPSRARAGAALALGGAFLGAQILVWRGLVSAGVGPASGIYGSVFFAISGFHALHVGGGLVALAALVLDRRSFASVPNPPREVTEAPVARRLRLCALYWDFVVVVWVLFYLGACLQ
jgi:cytochrome c oxidase subunit III